MLTNLSKSGTMMNPNTCLRLIGRKTTLAEALEDEDNILQELKYPKQRLEFCVHLLKSRVQILNIVARHLKVNPKACAVAR
jgi:hypothetical protein